MGGHWKNWGRGGVNWHGTNSRNMDRFEETSCSIIKNLTRNCLTHMHRILIGEMVKIENYVCQEKERFR